MKNRLIVTFAVALGLGNPAVAAPVVFTGSVPGLAASVSFDLVGGNLEVILTNTSAGDIFVPNDVLTAVFFSGLGSLTSGSAVLTAGSTVLFDAAPAGGVVGGEWAYGSGFDGPGLSTAGISSAGFGLFGGATFPGADLDAPAAVNGLNYGLLSAGDNPATGNAAVTGGVPLIKNSVTFTLEDLPSGFELSQIGNVSFQYGTALTEPNVPGGGGGSQEIPEPGSLVLLGAALLGLLGFIRRRKI